MPYAINGIGTQFYGRAKPLPASPRRHFLSWLVDPDNLHESWIVTEWITFLWLPLLPLGSARVWPVDYEHSFIGNRSRTSYRVRRLGLYWPQVIWGYAITFGLFASAWIFDERNLRAFRNSADVVLPVTIIGVIALAALVAFSKRGGTQDTGLTTTITLNPFAWPQHYRVGGAASVLLGIVIGIAVGFAITGRGQGFLGWASDQQYTGWPALGWGLLGGVVGGGCFFVWRLTTAPRGAPSGVLGIHPRNGNNVSITVEQGTHVINDGEIAIALPDGMSPDDVTLGLALKLIQNRDRTSGALRNNEVEVRFVRRSGMTPSDIKLLFRQRYSLTELQYCRNEFVKGLTDQSNDWNVAVRGLLEWAKAPSENMWYSVDLGLAAVASRAFPRLKGRDTCIGWFDQSGVVDATLVPSGVDAPRTVRLGALPVRS